MTDRKKVGIAMVACGLVAAGMLIPMAWAMVQFARVSDRGTGTVEASLTVRDQSALNYVMFSCDNTGAIPSGAYWQISLWAADRLGGGTFELARIPDQVHVGGSWCPLQPVMVSPGDEIHVTYPSTGELTGGSWCVKANFALK